MMVNKLEKALYKKLYDQLKANLMELFTSKIDEMAK
jgi:hypothetical protein